MTVLHYHELEARWKTSERKDWKPEHYEGYIDALLSELTTLRESSEYKARLTEAELGTLDAARRYALTRSDTNGVLLLKMAERLRAKEAPHA